VVLVRLLFFLAVAVIVVAFLLYLYKRDRRYLRFIVQVGKYMMFMMIFVLGFMLLERVIYLL